MFSYVFHGLLGLQGMLALYLLRISQVPDIPMVFPANRGTSNARLTAKAEGEAKISPPEGRTKVSGRREKDVKVRSCFFLEMEGLRGGELM